jgi:murein DD-endopeptidase MepM/ murein hydrolase activator NlpD
MKKRGKGASLKRRVSLAFFLALRLSAGFCAADEAGFGSPGNAAYPLIERLDTRDTLFRQFMDDVELSRRRLFLREQSGNSPAGIAASLTVYRYVPGKNEDILDIAARINIPYSSIASLNRLAHPVEMDDAGTLLLPSAPGIFLPDTPRSDLERLMASARQEKRETETIALNITRNGKREKIWFFPADDFNPTERIFFLNSGFRFPMRNFRITSGYGPRRNPVTGIQGNHGGVDLAAPMGTDVFAAAEGIVTEIGEDTIYGKYIIIKHGGNWASLYGHLSRVETALRQEVQSASLIGKVGSTGQSTGPHLHFELRHNGQTRDPGKYLFQWESPEVGR